MFERSSRTAPVLCLIAAVACAPEASTPAVPSSPTQPASAPVRTDESAAGANVPASEGGATYEQAIEREFAQAGLALGPPPLATWSLPDREPKFLGFSKDGTLYATRESFGHEEIPGGAPFWVEFVQLRDVHTNRVVRAFQGKPYKNEFWGDEVEPEDKLERQAEKLWKSLPPSSAADAELSKLGIELGKAARVGPKGEVISAAAVGNAPRGSRFVLTPSTSGYAFRWDRIKRIDDLERKTYAPRIVVQMVRDKVAATLVTLSPRTSYETLVEASDTRMAHLVGAIEVHWDPRGRRVLISFEEEMQGQHEEYGSVGRTSNYVRAVGPQIKIIDAGVGNAIARKTAMLFDAKGLYVTKVERARHPAMGAVLYYRGEAGKRAAESAAAFLKPNRLEELKKSGWVDLIVVLGPATEDPPAR